MEQKFSLDGVEILEESLTESGKDIIRSLRLIEAQLNEKQNIYEDIDEAIKETSENNKIPEKDKSYKRVMNFVNYVNLSYI